MGLMTLVVGLGVLSLSSLQREFQTFAEEDFPGFNHLLHMDRDSFRAQRSIERAFLNDDPDERREAVTIFEGNLDSTEERWTAYLAVAHNSKVEQTAQALYEDHRHHWIEASSQLSMMAIAGRDANDPGVMAALAESNEHFAEARDLAHELEENFYEPLVVRGTDADHFDARLLLVVLLACGLLLGGIASAAAVRATKKQYLELRTRELNKRFRSLVESAQDVITVVSGTDDLSIMSPDLGGLSALSPGRTPTTVCELLGAESHAIWEIADRSIIDGRATPSIELECPGPRGEPIHLEAHGSPMTDRHDERVWVWRDITERKQLELRLAHQAFHDPLTGLANRALLVDRTDHALQRSARLSSTVSMLFCDLDEFKAINDSLGHDLGDVLLSIVTTRLQGCIRDGDTLARFGGDEFAILLEDTGRDAALALAERIVAVVPYEVVLDGRSIFPSISIGVSTSLPETSTDELLRNADIAMYGAKRAGKCRVEVFEEGMDDVAFEVLDLQADIRAALQEDQFELYYQPSVSIESGRVEGVEALIRWNHPERGRISPDIFIPVAEASGSIVAIGRWVLRHACHEAVRLQEGRDEPISMHVNLSPFHLRDPEVVSLIAQCLDASSLPPELLVLEVTEGFLLDDTAAVTRLHDLHALGLKIAIDDFGTGYTSVSYLQQLPIDIIKIDRSFVSGDALQPSERKAFLHAIIGLAKSLNLYSVAEGIEHDYQLDELRELECDAAQGHLWAPAVPVSELDGVLAALERRPVSSGGIHPRGVDGGAGTLAG